MKNISLIAVLEGENETSVAVRGDGKIPAYMTQTIEFPPKIIIDIFCEAFSFETIAKPVSSSILKNIRVGHHPKAIRLVLDVNGADIPDFSSIKKSSELIITLKSGEADEEKKEPSNQKPQLSQEKSGYLKKTDATETNGVQENSADNMTFSGSAAQEEGKAPLVNKFSSFDDEIQVVKTLTQVDGDDGLDDTKVFLSGIYAYESQNWPEAIDNLNHLIKSYPAGRYTEKAYFLLAKAYEQLYSKKLISRFNEVKGYYEDAVYRYPRSIYVPDAHASIGNICLMVKNYTEALGHFNFVIEKGKDPAATLKALMRKAKILSLKKRKTETLSIYEHIINRYPGTSEEFEVKIEMVKLLFEMNSFKKSLVILTGLEKQLEDIYQYPDIIRYLGNNYYQLGNTVMARKNLFRYYNICPEKKGSGLILTRIADTYKEEGLSKAATKFYKLVLERHPNTEGALISMYRLAEQQEKGEIKVKKRELAPNIEAIDSEIRVPRKIYEDVIQNALEKDENSPLIQFALLKLSIIDKQEKKYEKSLKILKGLLKKYPRTTLRKEIEHTLEEILLPILEKDLKIKQYKNIINVYQSEKDIINHLKSPEIFLTIARASLGLNLYDMALELFKKSDPLLADEQKPPDLLFHIGQDLFDKGKYNGAIASLDLLLKHPPNEKYTPDAYLMKGKIFLAGRKYPQAIEMFSNALNFNQKRSRQTKVLISKAEALIAMNSKDNAYQAVQEADTLSRDYYDSDYHIYQEIADLYIRLGYPKEALSVIKYAFGFEKDEKNITRLKLMMALCYEALNKKKDYLTIYNEIVTSNHPFWSNVAKEKIEEIKFKDIIPKKKK